jgi:hypothetical protein
MRNTCTEAIFGRSAEVRLRPLLTARLSLDCPGAPCKRRRFAARGRRRREDGPPLRQNVRFDTFDPLSRPLEREERLMVSVLIIIASLTTTKISSSSPIIAPRG